MQLAAMLQVNQRNFPLCTAGLLPFLNLFLLLLFDPSHDFILALRNGNKLELINLLEIQKRDEIGNLNQGNYRANSENRTDQDNTKMRRPLNINRPQGMRTDHRTDNRERFERDKDSSGSVRDKRFVKDNGYNYFKQATQQCY